MTPKTVTCHGCLEQRLPDSVQEVGGLKFCRGCVAAAERFAKAKAQPEPQPAPAPVAKPEDDRYCFHCGRDFRSAEHRYGTGPKVCRDCFIERENADGLCDICDGELSGPGWLCEGNTCCEGCARTWAETIVPAEMNNLREEADEAESLKVAAKQDADRRKFYESSARTDLRCALDSAFELAKQTAKEFEALQGWLAEAVREAAYPQADIATLSNIANNVTSRLDWVSQYGKRAFENHAQFRAVEATLQTLRNLGPNNKA